MAQRLQDSRGVAHDLSNLALMALYRGEYGKARDLYFDSLSAFYELDDERGVAESIEGLAAVAGVLSQPTEAARLFGVATSLCGAVGAPLTRLRGLRRGSKAAPSLFTSRSPA